MMQHFVSMNSKLDKDPTQGLSVSEVCKIIPCSKQEADAIMRAYYSKYEKRLQGIFVVVYTRDDRIYTETMTQKHLSEMSDADVISVYLLAVRSKDLEQNSIDYSNLGFESRGSTSSTPAMDIESENRPPNPSTLASSGSTMKRSSHLNTSESTVNSTSEIEKQVQKVKTDDNKRHADPAIQTKNSSNLSHQQSTQQVKQPTQQQTQSVNATAPSKNLMSFFGKK